MTVRFLFLFFLLILIQQHFQEPSAVLFQLEGAHAMHLSHVFQVLWLHRRHIFQSGIGKYHKRRYLFFPGNKGAQLSEFFEKAAPPDRIPIDFLFHRRVGHDAFSAKSKAVYLFPACKHLPGFVGELQHRIGLPFPPEIAVGDEIVQCALDMGRLFKGQLPVGRRILQFPLHNRTGMAAMEYVGNEGGAEPFMKGSDGFENQHRHVGDIHPAFPAFAVAAVAAGLRHLFAEIGKDEIPKAGGGLAVVHHGVQPVIVHFSLVLILISLFDEVSLDAGILSAVKEDALGLSPVSAGPAGFLIVGFQTFGHLVMNHIAHIALVDTHAEGIGSHHDRHIIKGKIFLGLAAVFIFHTCVVAACIDAPPAEQVIHRIHRFPGGAVNNAAFLLVTLHIAKDEILLRCPLDNPERQVRPVQSRAEHPGLLQSQALLHVRLHQRRGRGGKGGDHRTAGKGIDEIFDFSIGGTEIVAPLGHAVGLVNDDHGKRHLGQALGEIGRLQLFRRHVEELDLPPVQIPEALDRLFIGNGAVHKGCRNPLLRQRLHLVLHEGNQGRNDNGAMGKKEGGNLEADGFSGSRRHDSHHIFSLDNGINHFPLPGPESVIAEVPLQHIRRSHVFLLSFGLYLSLSLYHMRRAESGGTLSRALNDTTVLTCIPEG